MSKQKTIELEMSREMAEYNVMVTRTRTVVSSCEFEGVMAKDEESAENEIRERIEKAVKSGKLTEICEFEDSDDTNKFEYQVSYILVP